MPETNHKTCENRDTDRQEAIWVPNDNGTARPAPLTWRDFPDFYANQFVQDVKNDPRWTMSTPEKVPIDMDHLVFNHTVKGLYDFPKGMYALDTLLAECDRIKLNPPNHTYYLDVAVSGYMVLDVEPSCPDEMKAVFLRTDYVYGETSMSGKGYHLVYKCPADILDKYPAAAKKQAVKEEHGWYEFLLCHFVTFTRHMLPPAPATADVMPYFEQCCAMQRDNTKIEDFDMDGERPNNVPHEKCIMNILATYKYKKTLADFNGDHSRYEFGMASAYHRMLANVIRTFNTTMKANDAPAHDYTAKEMAWMIYEMLVDRLEWREKHDTFRCGMPLLLYRAYCVIAINGKFPKDENDNEPKLTGDQIDTLVKNLHDNPV